MDSRKITAFFSASSFSSRENISDKTWKPISTSPKAPSRFSFESDRSSIVLPQKTSRTSCSCKISDGIQSRRLSLKNHTKHKKEIALTTKSSSNILAGKSKINNEELINIKRLKSNLQNGQKSIVTYLQKKDTFNLCISTDKTNDKSDEKENTLVDYATEVRNNSFKSVQVLDTARVFSNKENLIIDKQNTLSNDALSHSDSVDMFAENDLDELDACFIEDCEDEVFPKEKLDTWLDIIDTDKEVKEKECFEVLEICRAQREKLYLLLTSKESGIKRICILQGFWLNTFIKVGDSVRVLAEFADGCTTINDDAGLLIVNPDQLVSSTAIVSTLFCMRKAILSEKFPGWDVGNMSMLLGTLIHQLFQEVVQKGEMLNEEEMEKMFCSILQRSGNQHAIYAKKCNELEMENEAADYFPHIINWLKTHMSTSVSSSKLNDGGKGNVQVESVIDIEDNIWCPWYGIRGRIDLTAEVTIHNKRQHVPIELKTGRPTFSFEHQGQVALYTMMMNHRMGDCDQGFLLYLKHGPKMKAIHQQHSLQRDLIQLRNELAHYINSTLKSSGEYYNADSLPQPMNNKRSCQKCPFLLPCTIFQRNIEDYKPLDVTHAMHLLIPETINHLSSCHLDYFEQWVLFLELEKQNSYNPLQQPFWKESSFQREKKGLCFANMSLHAPSDYSDVWWDERNSLHTFRKNATDVKLLNMGLCQFDHIFASVENNNEVLQVATGEIIRITEEFVDVILDKNLYQKRGWVLNVYRLDKMTSNPALNINYINLLHLMEDDSMSSQLRRLLIDRVEPLFLSISETKLLKHPILSSLNEQQFECIVKIFSASDYLLIKGMPGSGKTSTLVTIVRLLAEIGSSILLTSYTHSALDNILIRLKQHNLDFVRLGQQSKIHHDIKPFSAELATQKISNVKELDHFYKSKQIVCTTCLGINHPIFQHRSFDICIIDEASQILQTACIGPLFHAKKFVLVGDTQQLPPVVQSKEARLRGMSESLFARLETNQNTVELNLQYRMNREITRLCNAIIYDGVLKCGSASVEYATLHFPDINILPDSFSWHKSVLSTKLCDAALFLNTDTIPGNESYDLQGLVQNETEVEIITQLIWTMIKVRISGDDIGVITPYKKQVHLLKDCLYAHKLFHIEVNTVDQYQGRDKPVVLISCVRSSTGNQVAELLEDERRLNVAISRAKHKLLIIGSKSTLLNYTPFYKLITALREEQVVNVPKGSISKFWTEVDELCRPINNIL